MSTIDHGGYDALLDEARGLLGLRKFETAVDSATGAIGIDARRPAPFLLRAEALRRLGRHDPVLVDLAVAIRDPRRAAPLVVRAEILRWRCQFDEAIADAAKAIFLDPNYAAAYSVRAACRLAIGDTAGAAEDHSELFRIDPTRPPIGTTAGGADPTRNPLADARPGEHPRAKAPRASSDIFADGGPVDRSYRSRPVLSDELAPEELGAASG